VNGAARIEARDALAMDIFRSLILVRGWIDCFGTFDFC